MKQTLLLVLLCGLMIPLVAREQRFPLILRQNVSTTDLSRSIPLSADNRWTLGVSGEQTLATHSFNSLGRSEPYAYNLLIPVDSDEGQSIAQSFAGAYTPEVVVNQDYVFNELKGVVYQVHNIDPFYSLATALHSTDLTFWGRYAYQFDTNRRGAIEFYLPISIDRYSLRKPFLRSGIDKKTQEAIGLKTYGCFNDMMVAAVVCYRGEFNNPVLKSAQFFDRIGFIIPTGTPAFGSAHSCGLHANLGIDITFGGDIELGAHLLSTLYFGARKSARLTDFSTGEEAGVDYSFPIQARLGSDLYIKKQFSNGLDLLIGYRYSRIQREFKAWARWTADLTDQFNCIVAPLTAGQAEHAVYSEIGYNFKELLDGEHNLRCALNGHFSVAGQNIPSYNRIGWQIGIDF